MASNKPWVLLFFPLKQNKANHLSKKDKKKKIEESKAYIFLINIRFKNLDKRQFLWRFCD